MHVEQVMFRSGAVRCAGDLYLPDGVDDRAPAPAVVMGHSVVMVKEALGPHAEHLVRAGFVVLAVDYRTVGSSEGRPPLPMAAGVAGRGPARRRLLPADPPRGRPGADRALEPQHRRRRGHRGRRPGPAGQVRRRPGPQPARCLGGVGAVARPRATGRDACAAGTGLRAALRDRRGRHRPRPGDRRPQARRLHRPVGGAVPDLQEPDHAGLAGARPAVAPVHVIHASPPRRSCW